MSKVTDKCNSISIGYFTIVLLLLFVFNMQTSIKEYNAYIKLINTKMIPKFLIKVIKIVT